MTAQAYNDPINGTPSSVGDEQFEMFKWQKKAMVEMAKTTVFGNLASTINMPKHRGKTIKRYHYVPMLDDANINDQGIDAVGLSVQQSVSIKLLVPNGGGTTGGENIYLTRYALGEGADAASALANAKLAAYAILNAPTAEGGLGVTSTDYADALTKVAAAGIAVEEQAAVPNTGNLYGSSKDVGTILGKLPKLDENGGRKNRVGGRRIELEGTMELFGLFREWTRESLDFDTDPELQQHMTREMMYGANELCEDMLQIDLLNSAGIVRFGGVASKTSEITGEGTESTVTFKDLSRLNITLDDNRCDKDTKIISGSRMQDTRTVRATRVMYIGSELIPMFEKMVDYHNEPAFLSVEKYAAAGTPLPGEIGKVGQFTLVVYQEMMHWAGEGATATGANKGYRETGGNYDVFPMLVVGNDSFNTIGFQTDGKNSKFKIINKMPGKETADRNDPYGMTGFSSIAWYYGFLAVRPERIAVYKTVAEY